jgi:hypothetical protein
MIRVCTGRRKSDTITGGPGDRFFPSRRSQTSLRHRSVRTQWRCWKSQVGSRIAELAPIRYGRMSRSPFAFFRLAASLMASDLAAEANTGLEVQLCGDVHLGNFGLFRSPSASWSSTSTTSTRRCQVHENGTSSGWWQVWQWQRAATVFAPTSARQSCGPARVHTANECACWRRCVSSTCGMPRPRSTDRSQAASTRRSPKRTQGTRPRQPASGVETDEADRRAAPACQRSTAAHADRQARRGVACTPP